MTKNKQLPLLIVMAMVLLVTGCFASNLIKMAGAMDKRAKQFKPAKGKAGIYIFRIETMTIGNGHLIPVSINGQDAGRMKDSGYFWLEVQPGEYTIATGKSSDKVVIKARTGQNYFIRQTTDTPFLLGVLNASLYQAEEKVAKAKIAECRLLVSKLDAVKLTPK